MSSTALLRRQPPQASAFTHLGDVDPLAAMGGDLPIILLSFPLCTALALCCDDWVESTPPPAWLRLAEAAGCGLVMAVSMAMVLIYLGDRLPFPTVGLPGWEITMVIGFPTSIAIVFGGCVPHIYRAARRAASIRREEASRSFAADAPLSEQPEAGVHRARAPSASQVASVMREETHSPVVDDAPQRRRPSDRPARRSAESADGSITNDAVSRR